MRAKLLVLVAAVALAVALAPVPAGAGPAVAGPTVVQRRGLCSDGVSRWSLTVRRADVPGRLRVRFVVRGASLASWQIFLSDNGHRIPGAEKTAGPGGVIRVVRRTRNRLGHDHSAASANQRVIVGVSCAGQAAF
jgi:hypothetical protein